jgi:RimJ/RimL family protein N-acetyltransferase
MAPADPIMIIRALTPEDAEPYLALRVTALATSPEAFGSSVDEEQAMTAHEVRARCAPAAPSVVFGAFAGDRLVGIAGFAANRKFKQRHKGLLWGVFVAPQCRGAGLGKRLVQRVIEHAAKHVLMLHANVTTGNQTARQLYHRLGFAAIGIERKALLVDGTFHDEELLALELPATRSQRPAG